LSVGHRGVGRLMRQNGTSVVRTLRHTMTTERNHEFNIAPNLLDRTFVAAGTDQEWAGDITYIWTREIWLYRALILNLHSRRIFDWATLGHAAQTLPRSDQQPDET